MKSIVCPFEIGDRVEFIYPPPRPGNNPVCYERLWGRKGTVTGMRADFGGNGFLVDVEYDEDEGHHKENECCFSWRLKKVNTGISASLLL